MTLTSLERDVIRRLMERLAVAGNARASESDFLAVQDAAWSDMTRCRERDECREKLVQLGLLREINRRIALKKGTGSEPPSGSPCFLGLWLGACPLFQHATPGTHHQ